MKILLTGGGTGGHFYPLIAVAEAIREIAKEEKLIDVELYYMSTSKYDERLLFEHDIKFIKNSTGKRRNYKSILNILDIPKIILGSIRAVFKLYSLYPDVVFSKGGYPSFPVTFAARILRIPVVIHDSDTVPGKANLWASKFARSIAIAWPSALERFPQKVQWKIAHTGNPLRKDLYTPITAGVHEYLRLEKNVPVILILGGSQGAQAINEALINALPLLVEKYQIIHQTGENNLDAVQELANVVLGDSKNKDRYKPYAYLNGKAMRMASGVADLVISRAGSSIFEIAAWGIPSIIIPIPEEISTDQRTNAFSYARTGSASVIEQKNLTPNIIISEIERILGDQELYNKMKAATESFRFPDAARKIATELLRISLEHEK